MSMLDFLWPHVGKFQVDETKDDDIRKISAASWGTDTAALLDEARRLRDVETGRKNAAETKSQIYLAVLLALIPTLVSLTESDVLEGIMAFDTWYRIIGFILFILGLTYGVGAFVSSFRALTIREYHRVDVNEIVRCGLSQDPIGNLTKEILSTVRHDRQIVNHKVSYVIVTHLLAFRMALFLLIALALITFSQPIGKLLASLNVAICS